ncbi:MAG: hypothetical protein KatS3mg056_1879 [Chloroflexus sp.]|nr:MAG: hypothetical protein KatS3mg056_1879 [Chloroflexus sp.]
MRRPYATPTTTNRLANTTPEQCTSLSKIWLTPTPLLQLFSPLSPHASHLSPTYPISYFLFPISYFLSPLSSPLLPAKLIASTTICYNTAQFR